MASLPNPSNLVQQSKIYGSVNPGNLYQLMKRASNGNVNRWYLIRDSILNLVNASNLKDIDNIYKGDNPFSTSISAPSNIPTPTLLAPMDTTPSDADVKFPASNSAQAQLDSFYKSAAYQEYIGKRMQDGATPGFDFIFNGYVQNNALSYESNRNIQGAMAYIYRMNTTDRDRAASTVVANLAGKNVSLTKGEGAQILSSTALTMVSGPNGVMMTPNQASGDIVVNGVTTAAPNYLPTLGLLTMLSNGVAFIPAPINTATGVDPATNNRSPTEREKAFLRGIASWKDPSKIVLHFGYGWNALADLAILQDRAMTQGNHIFFPGSPRDMTLSYSGQSLLAHEFYHSFQYDLMGIDGFNLNYIAQQVLYTDPYAYWDRNLTFLQETIEGQASIIGDYVFYKISGELRHGVSAAQLENWVKGSSLYGK